MTRRSWSGIATSICIGVIAIMIGLTVTASLDRNVARATAELWPDPWFRATLADTYFGFLAFWAWVSTREPTWARRILWLILICGLGSIAMAAYVLIQLGRRPRPSRLADLLVPAQVGEPR